MIWRARSFEFVFPRPALVMGIVNVTPDSFSDGGRFLDPARAIGHALQLAAAGADLLDVGGESTRPGAQPVSEAEELRRVMPVIEALAGRVTVPVSIDTVKPEVARAALDAGASLVNDVGANRTDPALWELVAATGAGYVCMHRRGSPQTMQRQAHYDDVVREVGDFFADRLRRLRRAGVARDQVALDPGIGFAKTARHNLQLLAGLKRLRRFGRPLLIGVSRKSFLGELLDVPVTGRLPGSLACACWAARAGAQLLRAHDVAETVQALRMTEALGAATK